MEEIVHIIPLGFERDRVVTPFKKFPATRIHILTVVSRRHGHKLYEQQARFTSLVERDLKELGIEIQIHDVDIFDLLETMKKMAELIKLEFQNGARVYINMSGAGRLTSLASALTGMYHGAQVYYVRASRYSRSDEERAAHGISICDEPSAIRLENFHFEKPSALQCEILHLLAERGELTTRTILETLAAGFEEFGDAKGYARLDRRQKQGLLMRLNRKLLVPLEQRGHILRSKEGRYNRIRITDSGRYLASIC